MKITTVGFTALVALFMIAGSVQAAPTYLINDPFESYSTPVSLSGLNPGDGNANNWTIDGAAGHTYTAVTDALAGQGNKDLRVTITTPSTNYYFFRNFASQTSGVWYETFLVRYNNDTVSDNSFTLNGSNGISVYLRFYTGQFWVYGDTGTGVGWKTLMNASAVAQNTWYAFTVTADIDANLYSVTVTNTTNPTNTATLGNITPWHTLSGLNRLNFAKIGAGNTDLSFDNIVIANAIIPEPATVGLMTLGGLMMTVRGRR